MNGTALKSVASLGTVGDTGYRIVSMADYDGDGRGDLLWRHQATGELWIWRLDGASVASATLVSTVDPAYEVAAPK